MRKNRTRKKDVAKTLIAKHKIKGTFEIKQKASWFSNAMEKLEKQEKKQ